MVSPKVSNVQINNSLDIVKIQCRVSEITRQAVSNSWTGEHRPPYVDSLTGGTASWSLFTALREYRDDKLCDAG